MAKKHQAIELPIEKMSVNAKTINSFMVNNLVIISIFFKKKRKCKVLQTKCYSRIVSNSDYCTQLISTKQSIFKSLTYSTPN